ncbi:DUF3560 domain-containing protein [Aeromonas jandaei]|uniref:DUF3560 domain-containing protein n=1 Tax=Aeromonas jandaei TaxID=650 RepID=UPI001C5ADB08|nr:DUF3560 domain-containing protein [Aeromonas jandaei]MBW3808161.1 DUF3560 domain-containing protein [Aeromonas jandaei]
MSATIITMEDFKAAAQQAAQFVRRPVTVTVHWSESGAWQNEQAVSYADFEKTAFAVALEHAGRGYLKTKITVTFDDGEIYQCRIDLAAHDELGFADHCLSMLAFYDTDKGRDYYVATASEDLIAFVQGIDLGCSAADNDERRAHASDVETAARLAIEEQRRIEAAAQETAANNAYAAELARLQAGAPEYAHLTPLGEQARGGVQAAKNVRRDLKNAFPGIKFSVTSSYDTINVSWQDGPTRPEVEAVIEKYENGKFDGMTDCFNFDTTPFNAVFGGCRYTFVQREHSEALMAVATRYLEQRSGEQVTGDSNQRIWGEWAQCLLTREANKITLVAGVWHRKGEPIVWQEAPQALAPVAAVKPKFTAQRVGALWRVTIEQGEERHQFEHIDAASMGEACRIAWAILQDGTTPPDDPDGGQPLPVAQVAEHTEQIAQGAEAPTLTRADTLGNYADRVDAKRERLEGRAGKAQHESAGRHAAVHSILGCIVPGQPILVGHHSERRHRRDLARVDQHMGQAVALAKKAEYLTQRAEAVGQGGIASDDPDALAQLQNKLAKREAKQQAMKEANKAQRGSFKTWQLSNNGAEVRRLRLRIEQIEKLHSAAPIEQAGQGWHMFEYDGRIQIRFDGKPAPELRQLCKGAGFVWSPSRCAWVRKVTARAVREARRLAGALPAED